MVFVVGPLSSTGNDAQLSPVLEGKTPPAVPVYFYEPGGSEKLAAKLEEHPCERQLVGYLCLFSHFMGML